MPPKRRNDTVIKVEDGEKSLLKYSILFYSTLFSCLFPIYMFDLIFMQVVLKLSIAIYFRLY